MYPYDIRHCQSDEGVVMFCSAIVYSSRNLDRADLQPVFTQFEATDQRVSLQAPNGCSPQVLTVPTSSQRRLGE